MRDAEDAIITGGTSVDVLMERAGAAAPAIMAAMAMLRRGYFTLAG
jgi:NAD(P)H-hydrate repair Nnr-like enzyme with NAD(P)H-hydrate epimerase domain